MNGGWFIIKMDETYWVTTFYYDLKFMNILNVVEFYVFMVVVAVAVWWKAKRTSFLMDGWLDTFLNFFFSDENLIFLRGVAKDF